MTTAVAYLVLANPSPKHNLGTLIRCASAFAVEEVIVVGASTFSTHGAHGSNKHVQYRCFDDWDSAATFLRAEKGCDLCGVVSQSRITSTSLSSPSRGVVAAPVKSEYAAATAAVTESGNPGDAEEYSGAGSVRSTCTGRETGKMPAVEGYTTGAALERCEGSSTSSSLRTPGEISMREGQENQRGSDSKGRRLLSTPVRRRPFRRSTAFLVGHRNRLEDEALDVCDFLVHAEQVGGFSIELGAPVTTSIALHHFTAWAKYEEREFTGEKFNVSREAARCRPPAQQENARAEERERLREELRAADPFDNDGHGGEAVGGGSALGWLEGGVDDNAGQGDY
ncbi:unnamed protein product [Pylaiella littoralis]